MKISSSNIIIFNLGYDSDSVPYKTFYFLHPQFGLELYVCSALCLVLALHTAVFNNLYITNSDESFLTVRQKSEHVRACSPFLSLCFLSNSHHNAQHDTQI